MADVARLAGVSTATVSRALNDSPLINAETRSRITALARSLNYSINAGAQNLRLGQNRTVALVVPLDSSTRQHLSDPFFLAMVGSVADALTELGFDMLLSRVDAEQLDSAAALYDAGRAIGIILIGQWRHHDQLNALAVRRVPIVVWGAQLPQQLYSTVGGDNFRGGQLATAHLLSLGRRDIAFFGDTDLPEVAQRHAGYLQALHDAGFEARAALCPRVPFVPELAAQAVQNLQRKRVHFDAVFACSDLLAMAAISALRASGKRVPEDVAVVGYDDVHLAEHFFPALSTIRQPIDDAGKALVSTLLALIDGERPAPVQLQTTLVIRDSSAG
ncbi:MAG: LacI family DNA-binding transcriptional regulator [Pseudomonadota bacterium]|nr:LacI family DNA-binding transcriptional regulator [Pseudomonadota bacterium]